MYCPKCGGTYAEGIVECTDCCLPLVEKAPLQAVEEEGIYIELITVFRPRDSSELMIAKSILDSAGIRYFAKGESLKNIYPGSQLFGINAVELQVSEEDVPAAKEMLQELH
ncbi:MAG: DUF2007 domain-containing protein [Firmicutes bacterium]|nr:DUF2007 domain-containing protein [Bacillota bacterium]